MRASWRNLDWVGEADRGQIEKRLAGIGGEGSSLLDRVDFLGRDPGQTGGLHEVRITGNVAKNQIAAVRRDTAAEAAFHAALEAFERSAHSVSSARSASASAAAALQTVRLQAPTQIPRPPLAPRWRPDFSLPRLNLSLDRQALFERLAQPTRGAWRFASRLPGLPSVALRRAFSREVGRNLDRDRAEALERMSWRERLAALAMWNEVEAAERWAREQVFARRWRSEMDQMEQGQSRRQLGPVGWRERLADLSLWNELESAERWAREQVLARLRRGERELPGVRATAELSETLESPLLSGSETPRVEPRDWRTQLVDLSSGNALESIEPRVRGSSGASPRLARAAGSPTSRRFEQLSSGLQSARGLARRGVEAVTSLVQVPMPVRVGASLSVAVVIGLWSFQGASFTGVAETPAPSGVAYSAVAMPEGWPRSEAPFSAVAVPFGWEKDGAPYSAVSIAGAPLIFSEIAFSAIAKSTQASVDVAYSAVAVPGRSLDLADDPVALNSVDSVESD